MKEEMAVDDCEKKEFTDNEKALGRIFYYLLDKTTDMVCAGNADIEQIRRNAETIMKLYHFN